MASSPMRPTGADIERAIATHFDGDAALYAAFASSCTEQFVVDAATARAACASGNLERLRRLGHDLKSALVMLGHTDASALATVLEHHARALDLAAACAAWRALESALPLPPGA
jgi:HPt (histidine-containing phosphotransfer) domain-containing protein